ncbi:hypothetical protein A2239_02880 [Candidatus Uhrbacteria bacterium RIFOXYA2_FULL_40_9]|nr:MAG: hypothetical protein A2239_02880 [Candidatus Uhrbacteria bacterium RIFOXYA2_FULL_40_9]
MEPNLVPFETVVIEPNGKRYSAGLITSPEYSMKKLLGLGEEKIFTITKVFRNEEEFGGRHNPEFSMLEWYQQGADYQACMNETEALVQELATIFGCTWPIFQRLRVQELFLQKIGIDLDVADYSLLKHTCEVNGMHTDETDTESDLFYRLFLEKIEPFFEKDPLFVYDYPKHQAALSQMTSDGRYGQRFELYLNGIELCNGFTELTDAEEQLQRFEEEARERKNLKKTVFPIDETLLRLLPSLKNPSFGNALGIDRLHMVLTNTSSIEDVLLFPISQLYP